MATKRIVVVGIPGVGKTTVIDKVVEKIKEHRFTVESVVFGTLMFEEAKKLGVNHRDEMRRLSIEDQRKLQMKAAERIAKMKADFLLIDTHLMIFTKEGYWPGLPIEILKALSPSNLILIEALPKEIISRRRRDSGRYRDSVDEGEIIRETEIARGMLSATGVITGVPMLIVMNKEDYIEGATQRILEALGVM